MSSSLTKTWVIDVKKLIKCILILICILAVAGLAGILSFQGEVNVFGGPRYWDHTHFVKGEPRTVQGSLRYYGEDGLPEDGWITTGGGRSYVENGRLLTGDQVIDGKEYYFNEDGLMMTGPVSTQQGKRFYDENGERVFGFVQIDGKMYYYSPEDMLTGWQDIEGSRYYFTYEGAMMVGRKRIGGDYYHFRKDGSLITEEWIEESEGTAYAGEDGKEAEGKKNIHGKTYIFSKDAILYTDCWIGNSFAYEDGSLAHDTEIDGLALDHKGIKIYDHGYGQDGSLYIPDVGVSVRLYKTLGDEEGQDITDRADSAAWFTTFAMPVIADHRTQGFDRIKNCTAGETCAFILTKNSVKEYICTYIGNGSNTEYDILDGSGTSVDESGADLCLYTCNEDWQHVTVVLFKQVKNVQ